MAPRFDHDVAIIGAGPAGVCCALALAQRGVRVVICELENEVNRNPRAATTHPATLEMLAELQILDDVIKDGVVAKDFQFWDRVTGTKVATFDHGVLASDTPYPFVVQCEQHKIANIGLDRLRAIPNAVVMMGTRLAGFTDKGDTVALILADQTGDQKTISVQYMVGCDGGRSFVRKSLGINFEGFTHPERFLVLSTPFDFETELGVCYRNYFSDPGEWANLFKVSGDDGKGLWRAVFPTKADETEDEALADSAVQARLQRFFPRNQPYNISHRNIYRVHQRVAASFRNGRVLLAGDSAHVNNPIGGLGMNCGIHDAMAAAEAICGVLGGDDEIAFDAYDHIRRSLNVEYVQQQTIQNKRRLEEKDFAAREKSLADLAAIAADSERHRQHLLRTSLLESVRKSRTEITEFRKRKSPANSLAWQF